jgi:Cd2+/Zn2+-exporting ATPase
MDCAGEEAEIRRALEPIAGSGYRFQLSQRTLKIDADTDALAAALLAITEAGFEPKLISSNTADSSHAAGDGHDHELVRGTTQKWSLALAIAAEGVGYFAPETMAWKVAGFAVAAIAI